MRIAYICADPGIPVFGQKGCSIHVQEVMRAFRQQGATVELFALRWGDGIPADLADVTRHHLPPVPKGDAGVREQVALAINPELQTQLARKGPFDLIYERYSLWSYSALEFAQIQGIPGILEVNAPLIEEQAIGGWSTESKRSRWPIAYFAPLAGWWQSQQKSKII